MLKVRDLAITTIPSDSPGRAGAFPGGYWMSVYGPKPATKKPTKKKPAKKAPSKKAPSKKAPSKKKASALPAEAVYLMRQQLQQRIKKHVYS